MTVIFNRLFGSKICVSLLLRASSPVGGFAGPGVQGATGLQVEMGAEAASDAADPRVSGEAATSSADGAIDALAEIVLGTGPSVIVFGGGRVSTGRPKQPVGNTKQMIIVSHNLDMFPLSMTVRIDFAHDSVHSGVCLVIPRSLRERTPQFLERVGAAWVVGLDDASRQFVSNSGILRGQRCSPVSRNPGHWVAALPACTI